MPVASLAARVVSAGLALVAAFLWATYYLFVLGLSPKVTPSALLVYPFLFGGAAYAVWTLLQGHGRVLVRLTGNPSAWLRIVLIVFMQISVLASTYLAGAVDTSLLSLIGDVVVTPALVMAVIGEGRDRARSLSFLGGVGLSAVGASLTIVAGASLGPIRGWGLLAAPTVPLAVAFYFVLSARESMRLPTSAVVGHATLGGAVVSLLVVPFVPGGFPGLLLPSLPALGLVIALGVTSFFVAPALYFHAIARAGIVIPTLMMAAIPVFTLLLAWGILGLAPATLAFAGLPLAVVGALLAVRGTHTPWAPVSGVAARSANPNP